MSLSDIARGIQYGYTAKSSNAIKGPRYLRITDIQDESVDWTSVPTCEMEPDKFAQYRLQEGDLLFARSEATTGKTYLVRDCPEAVFASYLIRVQLVLDVSPDFVYLFFRSPMYWRQISEGKRGMAQPNVNAQTLRRLTVPLPPRDDQDEIVRVAGETLSVLDALEDATQKRLSGPAASASQSWGQR